MRHLLTLSFILLAAPALAQGSITIGTPIVPATPPTIASYVPIGLTIRPGAAASIVVELAAANDPTKTLVFEYPRDCGSFGSSGVPPVPNPPVCPALDTSSEVDALITTLNTVNLSTRSLWRRVFDRLVADFPSRFPGGGTVQ